MLACLVIVALEFVTLTLGSIVGFTPSFNKFNAHGGWDGGAWLDAHYPNLVWRMLLILVLILVPFVAIAYRKVNAEQSSRQA